MLLVVSLVYFYKKESHFGFLGKFSIGSTRGQRSIYLTVGCIPCVSKFNIF